MKNLRLFLVQRTVLILFLSAFSIFSCKEDFKTEDSSLLPPIDKKIEGTLDLIGDKLHFSSLEYFNQYVLEMSKKQSKVELNKLEATFESFVSMRSIYENLSESEFKDIAENGIPKPMKSYVTIAKDENGELEIKRVITDPLLASLSNKEGYILIGEDAFKFEYDNFYIIKNSIKKSSSRLDEEINGKLSSAVIKGKISHGYSPINSANAKLDGSTHCLKSYSSWPAKRMAGVVEWVSIYNDNSPGGINYFASTTFITKHQSRYAGIWVSSTTSLVKLTGSVLIRYNRISPIFPDYLNIAEQNDSWAEYSYPTSGFTNPDGSSVMYAWLVVSASTTHYADCNDGQPRQCTLDIIP